MGKNFYEILEISPNASPDIIEAVYKRLAKRYHPDLQKGMPKTYAEEKMMELNMAYEILKDPYRRVQYDTFLKETKKKYVLKPGFLTGNIKLVVQEVVNVIFERVNSKIKDSYIAKMKYPLPLMAVLVLFFCTAVSIIGFGFDKTGSGGNQLQLKDLSTGIVGQVTSNKTAMPDNSTEKLMIREIPADKFTLGSPQSLVRSIMGTPTTTFLYSWSYGSSLVYFDENGRVDGWAENDKRLKVWLGDKKKNAKPFRVGSSKSEVIEAMGTPTSVFMESWSFDKTTVYFDEKGKVKNWVVDYYNRFSLSHTSGYR